MTNQKTIEERISALEQRVSDLETQLSARKPNSSQESNTSGEKPEEYPKFSLEDLYV